MIVRIMVMITSVVSTSRLLNSFRIVIRQQLQNHSDNRYHREW